MIYYPYIVMGVVILILVIIAIAAYVIHTPGSYLVTVGSLIGIGTIIITMTIAYCNLSLQHNAHNQMKRNNTRKANLILLHLTPEEERAAVSLFNFWDDALALGEYNHHDQEGLYHRLTDVNYHRSYTPLWDRYRKKYSPATQRFGDAFIAHYPHRMSYDEFMALSR